LIGRLKDRERDSFLSFKSSRGFGESFFVRGQLFSEKFLLGKCVIEE